MLRFSATLTAFLFLASFAHAAVIYEPVQYQYRTNSGRTFYYGGHDERVFALSQRLDCLRGQGCAYLHPGLIDEPTAVYTDCLPYLNAAVYGYTPVDARNAAYANATRYFRKSDVLAAAPVEPDGTVTVPAQFPPASAIDIRPWRPAARSAGPQTQPASRPLLILPKPAPGAAKGQAVVLAR